MGGKQWYTERRCVVDTRFAELGGKRTRPEAVSIAEDHHTIGLRLGLVIEAATGGIADLVCWD